MDELTGSISFVRLCPMSNPREGKSFSNNEVMALIESFRLDIRLIAEDIGSLKEDMTEVKNRLGSLETKVQTLEDAVRLSLPRISKLEAKVGA